MHLLDVPETVIKYANVHEALRRDLGAKYALHSLDLFLRPGSLDHG